MLMLGTLPTYRITRGGEADCSSPVWAGGQLKTKSIFVSPLPCIASLWWVLRAFSALVCWVFSDRGFACSVLLRGCFITMLCVVFSLHMTTCDMMMSLMNTIKQNESRRKDTEINRRTMFINRKSPLNLITISSNHYTPWCYRKKE